MKKIIVFLFVVSLIFLINNDNSLYISNAIRYRIIANSDSIEDQNIKWQINKELMPIINELDTSSKENTDKSIRNHLSDIENVVSKYTLDYQISYGNNYFPIKEYHNVIYEEGNYPSLVIKIGKSSGHNWWCFMFPPLCTLEAQKDDLSDVEYDYYFKNIIKKYL